MIDQEFENLLRTYLDGHISHDDLIALDRSITENPGHRHRFQEEVRLQTLLREAVVARIELDKIPGQGIPGAGWKRLVSFRTLGIAATVMLVAMAIFGWTQSQRTASRLAMGRVVRVGMKDQPRTGMEKVHTILTDGDVVFEGDRITTSPGTENLLQLNDGTLLAMQGGSVLRIDKNQEKDIDILLEQGAVLFEVTKRNPGENHVIVRTPQAVAVVLGTLFDLETESTWTRMKVYEGAVQFRPAHSGKSVKVASDQYAETWGDNRVQVQDLRLLDRMSASPQMILSPSDDVYVMGDQVVNSHVLYVEGQERKTYLRFNVPDVGPIRNATLELSQMIDTGEGTLHFYAADDRPWTEQDLRAHEVPEILYPIGQYIGTVGLYHVVSVDVSSWIKTPGAYTIVVTLDGEGNNDISFGSREGRSGPRLIINNQVQAASTAARMGASPFPYSNSMIEVGGTVGRMVLEPTDDVFLEANRCVNREFLHVEGDRRVTYLRFDIPEGDPFEKVKLVLAQSRDAGVGTIHAFLGSHAEWSERNFNSSRVPKTEKELGSYTGVVVPSQIVEIDVSDLGTHFGPCTLILTLDGTGADDIGFSSKEGPRGPRLVLWHGQGRP